MTPLLWLIPWALVDARTNRCPAWLLALGFLTAWPWSWLGLSLGFLAGASAFGLPDAVACGFVGAVLGPGPGLLVVLGVVSFCNVDPALLGRPALPLVAAASGVVALGVVLVQGT